MDASYLSFLRTNDFHCVFRYYYGVNANTEHFVNQRLRQLLHGYMLSGILLEISVDGPKAYQQKFPWVLIGPGVWGPPRPPLGSRGNAPVGGPRAPRAENDSSIAGSLYLSSP